MEPGRHLNTISFIYCVELHLARESQRSVLRLFNLLLSLFKEERLNIGQEVGCVSFRLRGVLCLCICLDYVYRSVIVAVITSEYHA